MIVNDWITLFSDPVVVWEKKAKSASWARIAFNVLAGYVVLQGLLVLLQLSVTGFAAATNSLSFLLVEYTLQPGPNMWFLLGVSILIHSIKTLLGLAVLAFFIGKWIKLKNVTGMQFIYGISLFAIPDGILGAIALGAIGFSEFGLIIALFIIIFPIRAKLKLYSHLTMAKKEANA